ncbi:hypothetical protein POSPLADRAFT_1152486 [Postia placenta MAD-698-R-SB12]|uniref:Membrane-associated protein n=1 Tax=Postia placenta MAD-698-R-SB12 TaxID=670580 RepID=A0A1X6MPT7_9APHY|nr:hypothetical protein POSPLADRAFT_1152486 [Postia placenta MAD-698-R-SB12]OSX58437.1 hypothetical protein POSPLADRAFT_1152486 [Postia placenta MAD-698-R-SB12]
MTLCVSWLTAVTLLVPISTMWADATGSVETRLGVTASRYLVRTSGAIDSSSSGVSVMNCDFIERWKISSASFGWITGTMVLYAGEEEDGAGAAAGIVGGGAVFVEVLEGAATPFDVPDPEASALFGMAGVNLDTVEDLPSLPKLKEFSFERLDPAAGVERKCLHSRAIVDLEEHRQSGGCCGISSMPLVDSISYCETRDSAGAETSVWKDDLAFGVPFALAVPNVDLRELAGAYPAAMIAAVVAHLDWFFVEVILEFLVYLVFFVVVEVTRNGWRGSRLRSRGAVEVLGGAAASSLTRLRAGTRETDYSLSERGVSSKVSRGSSEHQKRPWKRLQTMGKVRGGFDTSSKLFGGCGWLAEMIEARQSSSMYRRRKGHDSKGGLS